MTGLINNIIKRLRHLERAYDKHSSNSRTAILDYKDCAEISENGFQEGVKFILFGKATLHRRFKKYYWKDVRDITVYTGDMFGGIEFVLYNGKAIRILDYDMNWDGLVAELPRHFPGFNVHNLTEIKKIVGGDLPCWSSQKKIGNLLYDEVRSAVIWEETGEVYYTFED